MQKITSLEPIETDSTLWSGLIKVLLGIAIISCLIYGAVQYIHGADPYVQAVLSSEGNPDHGESLFELNCAACHGNGGIGRVGPRLQGVSLRRSDLFLIEQVTSGNTPPMPQFQPDPQEMADLISYLKSL